jgi:hypothetical protein
MVSKSEASQKNQWLAFFSMLVYTYIRITGIALGKGMTFAAVMAEDKKDISPVRRSPIKSLFLIKELASSAPSQWLLDKGKVYRCTIKKPNGTYRVTTFHIPNQFDTLVLYLLLNKLYSETQFLSRKLETTSYEVTRYINKYQATNNTVTFEHIMDSLTRLHCLTVAFDGIFSEGDGHTIRFFNILTDVTYFENGELHIGFNQQYLQQLCSINFSHLPLMQQALML